MTFFYLSGLGDIHKVCLVIYLKQLKQFSCEKLKRHLA